MKEKDFETNLQVAALMFATKLQKVMENSSDAMAEKIVDAAMSDDNFGIEEMTKEIAIHVISELSKEFDLQEASNEAES